MLGDIDKNLKPYEHRLYLCKSNMETIAELSEAYNKKAILNYGQIHELSFNIPYKIEKNKKYIRNPHVDIIRGHYLIRYEKFDTNTSTVISKDYYIITQPKNRADDGIEYKEIQCYLLPYELDKKYVRNYSGTKTLNEVLTDTLLSKTTWTIGYINYNLEVKSRTFDVPKKSLIDFINELADTFDAIVTWDTENRKINFYENEELGEDKGLNIEYGKYLKNIGEEPDFDSVVTRLYAYGKDNLSINRLTYSGLDYVEDLGFYLYPYDETITDETNDIYTVNSHSNYMSDELCHAILKYNRLLESKEGEFNSLFDQKESLQSDLSTKENELFTLETDLQIIKDDIDIALADNQAYESGTTYYPGAKVIYNDVPYQCTSQSTGNLPTNTTYWENLITKKNNKQTEIDNKQAEIDQINSDIANVDADINALQNEIAIENNFTSDQIIERDHFLKEEIWSDNNYYDDKELYNDAVKRLKKLSQPLISYEVDIVDFLKVVNCQRDWNKLSLGDIVTIRYPSFGINIKAKIITIEHDIDNNGLNLTIANDKDIKNGFLSLKDMLNQSVSTSNKVDMSQFTWDKSKENASTINEIINNAWDATKNKILAGVNESVEISDRGLIIKNPNNPNNMLIAQSGVLALSEDGGQSWRHAILPDRIVAENIMGKLGAFCTLAANQIVVGDSGEKIDENLIDGNFNSTYINQDGVKVIDSNGNERVNLGEYITGKYGLKVTNGEIYSTTIRTGDENATDYIQLNPGSDPLKVVKNGNKALDIWAGSGGRIQFYDTLADEMYGQITAVDDYYGKNLRITGRNTAGLRKNVVLDSASTYLLADNYVDIYSGGGLYKTTVHGDLYVTGEMSAGGGKPARQSTEHYGERKLYAKESPDVRYEIEDIAQFINGECRIEINPIFLECIEPNTNQTKWTFWFTPLFEHMDICVTEIGENYFIIKEKEGVSNSQFCWKLSAIRKGFAGIWLDKHDEGEEVLTSGWEDEIEEVV